ncbi:MAG: UDP-N-acetylmuramoyl-L-alanine--D-glutamate ligase [Bacteroidales bacterium]|nr:UDP-N-acetylmuramoyl-L-alanine--D-glutamate ligase [Bacteroidales bacterium]MCF8333291.1 UDP-N-acetylmuramoyl-L-alanine--D-glutamate ligase [Bacteroidales bacterium]
MENKNIVILGAAESGTGAAVLAKMRGMNVFVSDNSTISPKYKHILKEHAIDFEEKGHSREKIHTSELVIKSPGIPDHATIIQELREKSIPIISEIEFASWFTEALLICVTGSNGKTTTATMIHRMLKNDGRNAALAGNVGESFAFHVALEDPVDYYVLEISSFQLDYMFSVKADIAVITNITPDHLDRYDQDLQAYINSKFRILNNMTSHDHLVYCADDLLVTGELHRRKPEVTMHPFSIEHKLERGAYTDNNTLIFTINKIILKMTLEELALQGKHNTYNSMAAGIAARLVDIRKESIRKCLKDFESLEHRLENVVTIHGIEFINDSKATNVNSTWYALESMNKPVIWIAGGQDKGNDYEKLHSLVNERVKTLICLGKDNSKMIEAFKNVVDEIYDTQSMPEAVGWAYQLAEDSEVVLLSPACASFDLFENYEDRGTQFKTAVKGL